MSCDTAVRQFCTTVGTQIAPALNLPPDQAADVLREVWDLAHTRAEARIIPPDSDQTTAGKHLRLQARAADAAAREATITCFQAMATLDSPLAPPSHGDPDAALGFALPRLGNQHAWRAVWETMQAALAGAELPELAREVQQAQIVRAGGNRPALPSLLPNGPIPPGIASFAGHTAITGPGSPLARIFGGPLDAEDALGRIYATARAVAENVAWRAPDERRMQQDRADCAALTARLTALGLPLPPIPEGTQPQNSGARAALAVIERVISSAERGEALSDGGAGVLHVAPIARHIADLPARRQRQLQEARHAEDPNVRAALTVPVAFCLQHGPDRDALLGEAFRASLSAKPSLRQRQDLQAIVGGLPSAHIFDDAIGQMLQGRSPARVQEQLAVVLPYVDDATLDRWEGRHTEIRPANRQALDAAIADERARRHHLRTGTTAPDEICPSCERSVGVRIGGQHNCTGPSVARVRAQALIAQAESLLRAAPDAAARTAVLDAVFSRLDQIAAAAADQEIARHLNATEQAHLHALAERQDHYQNLMASLRASKPEGDQ